MLSTFLPDAVTYHFHGTIASYAEIRAFFGNMYDYLIPSVARYAANHVVDEDEDSGVLVRYQNYLLNYAWPGSEGARAGEVQREEALPGLSICSAMVNRLMMTGEWWWILERYVVKSVVDERMEPRKKGE